jgi:hypothetical protein
MPTLRETQRRFFELITAPESIEKTLAARGLPKAHIEDFVVGDAFRRLDVYANMYFFRLLEVLEDDYPSLRAALGPERFHNLATDYLQAHPSTHPSVRHVGKHLPEMLASRGDDEWLRELAQLERARLDCFDAAEAETLTIDHVREHPDIAQLELALIPASRRLEMKLAVDECWDQAQAGSEVTAPREAPRSLVVWRQGVEVFHRVLDEDEALVLGLPRFGNVCDQLPGAPEAAAQRAFALLGRWLSDGIVKI